MKMHKINLNNHRISYHPLFASFIVFGKIDGRLLCSADRQLSHCVVQFQAQSRSEFFLLQIESFQLKVNILNSKLFESF